MQRRHSIAVLIKTVWLDNKSVLRISTINFEAVAQLNKVEVK